MCCRLVVGIEIDASFSDSYLSLGPLLMTLVVAGRKHCQDTVYQLGSHSCLLLTAVFQSSFQQDPVKSIH